MEQKEFIKNLTSTVCVVGMALNAMSHNSTQMLMDVRYDLSKNRGIYSDCEIDTYTTNTTRQSDSVFLVRDKNILMKEAESLFGKMRAASDEELEGVNNYIKSISVETGVDFLALC